MEEARAVLARLERIDALERARADRAVVLAELRELVREAETWARRERDPAAIGGGAAGRARDRRRVTSKDNDLPRARHGWPKCRLR